MKNQTKIKNYITNIIENSNNKIETFEFSSGREIIKFVKKYPEYYFTTMTSPHSTHIEVYKSYVQGSHSAERIIKAARNGDYD